MAGPMPVGAGYKGGVSVGQVQRAVRGLTFGTVKAADAAQTRQWTGAIDEYDQQFQVPFGGLIGKSPMWANLDVTFDVTFMYAPDERDSPYPNPLFTYGLEFLKGHAFVTAAVVAWAGNGDLGVHGATLTIGAMMPAATKLHELYGLLHLNFEGYASPEPDPDETDTDEETDLTGGEPDGTGEDTDIDLGDTPEDP